MSKVDDMDDDFLPPPPSDDAPSGAPNFGGWELLALLALRDGDPKLMKKSIEDPQFNVSDDVFYHFFEQEISNDIHLDSVVILINIII